MNPILLLIRIFDWRGALGRAAYRRNMAVLVLVNLILRRLDLWHGEVFFAWTAMCWAMILSLNAQRYHDMGRSAAWMVWANLIAAAAAIAAFQLLPNGWALISAADDLRLDAEAQAVIGRVVLPAIAGAIIGNLLQSIWLARAPSFVGINPYATPTAALPPLSGRRDDEALDEGAAQAIIDRHLAARQSQVAAAAPSARPSASGATRADTPRVFGRRRA